MNPDRGGRDADHRPTAPASGVMVGRERELAALLAGLADAVAGRGRLFVVAGEPGIGKSRLADELATQAKARGARVLWGRRWEAGAAPAYWPWVQALRACLRGSDKDTLRARLGPGALYAAQILPEVRELFTDLPPPPSLEPDAARFCLFDAVTQFLKNLATAQPVVLLLDDIHAADAPSLLLLQFLARELTDTRILVVATYRDTELRPDHLLAATLAESTRQPATRTLPLRGLGTPELARFIELATGHAPPERLVAAVQRETDGNPLFVGELVRLLADEGRLEHAADATAWRLTIPLGIKQVIGRRVDHLSDDCKRVLTVASVLGREFSPEVLERVIALPGSQLLGVLEEAASARVVAEAPGTPGQLRFSHALVRDVLYDDLVPRRRIRLHRRVAEALESLYAANLDPHLAELAYHFIEATPEGGVGEAIRYARAAGDRAMRLLAYEEAVRLYQMAVQATHLKDATDEVTRCDLLLALGDAQTRAGELPAAKETFLRAADLARSSRRPAQLAQAALGYGGRFVWEAGRGDRELVPLLEAASSALGEEESLLRVKVMARLAGGPLRDQVIREPRAALSLAAVEMARRLGDPATLAYALDGRYAAVWWPDNLEERLGIASELIRVAEEARDQERAHQGYHYRCLARLELGDMPGVYADLDAQARLAEELRQPAQGWYVAAVRATLATFQGRLDDAERLIPQAFALGQRAQGWMAAVYHALQLYALRREQARLGEVEEAVRRLARDFPTYPVLRAVLAQLCTELGRAGDAREVFEGLAAGDFAAVPVDDEWVFSMSLLAEVAESLGDAPRGARLYSRLLPFAGRNALSNPDVCIGSVSRSLGLLAAMDRRWQEATRHFDDALAMNAATGARPWLARTQHDYARALLGRDETGDRERAGDLLAQALETGRELRLPALTDKVSALLDRLGAGPAAPRRTRPAPGVMPAPAARPTVFRREGEYWSITFEGQVFRLKDAKGLRYLARLLGDPGQELHVLALVAAEEGLGGEAAPDVRELPSAPGLGDAGEILDPEAKAAYRRRLAELEEEAREADAWRDAERATRAREEMDVLRQELAGAFGLGGRDRRAASAAERARVNVTRAIRAALVRIREHSPTLHHHLDSTIRTGIFCSYTPDPRVPISWQF